jgi:hypothetical protein
MNPEPPSDTSHEHEEEPTEESGDPSSGRGGQRTLAGVVGVLLVAGGVAAFLFLPADADPPAEQSAPAEGLACPHLLRAAEAYGQGNRAEFDREIDQAAAIAEATLQESGKTFGEPERIALELDLGDRRGVPNLLARVETLCSEVGQ